MAYEEAYPRSHGAYIGIAITSGGELVGQTLEPMPNWNTQQDVFHPVIQRGVKTVCILGDGATDYVVKDAFAANCRTLQGHYAGVETSLFYRPYGMSCHAAFAGDQRPCYGGDYYFTVSPTKDDPTLRSSVPSRARCATRAPRPASGSCRRTSCGCAEKR